MEMKEFCIRCNKPTPYSINTPISARQFYIDGSGQLCQSCYEVLYVRGKGRTDEVGKGEMEKIEKDGLERLKAAREEQPLHRSDFTEAELEKLKRLAPEEYELLK